MRFVGRLVLLVGLFAAVQTVSAQEIYTVKGPESANDKRYYYVKELVRLSLEKTEEEYGAFVIHETPANTNLKRAMHDARLDKYPNYFVRQSASSQLIKEMAYVPFPVERGIAGFRVAFVSKQTRDRLRKIEKLHELREIPIVQGLEWLDIDILRSHKFIVEESPSYEGMFQMVANNRVPMFMRGAHEVFSEWESHKHIENFMMDDSIALHYPLPRFLFTAKKNEAAAKRIHKGLLIAFEDGSLLDLWEDCFAQSILFSALENRKIFYLDNPLIEDIDPSYKEYLFNPNEYVSIVAGPE